jgi:hypothetical protein
MQPIILQTMPPADPAITGAALQSCRGKAEEAKPFIAAGDDIPDRIADFRQSAEIMMLLHQFSEIWVLLKVLPDGRKPGINSTWPSRVGYNFRKCTSPERVCSVLNVSV